VDGTKRGTVTTSDDDTLAAATVEMPRTDAITRGATSSPTWWRGQGVQPPFGSLPAPAVSAVAALSGDCGDLRVPEPAAYDVRDGWHASA